MKFGVKFYGTYPDLLVGKAQLAERLGYESLWRGDHLIMPDRLGTDYPYGKYSNEKGREFPTDARMLDILLVLSYTALATDSIRLATSVFIVPLRDPVSIARGVGTLDVLSGGRVIFGVGIGWMVEEYHRAGKDFRTRGRVLDESLDIIEALWTLPVAEYEGNLLSLPPATFEPKPVQQPRPPVVVGGESDAALKRAARRADGWVGHMQGPKEARERVAYFDALREQYGRSDHPFEVTVRVDPDVTVDTLHRLEDAGVHRVVLEVGSLREPDDPKQLDQMEEFADRVVSHYP